MFLLYRSFENTYHGFKKPSAGFEEPKFTEMNIGEDLTVDFSESSCQYRQK